jgi:hypothetical protein
VNRRVPETLDETIDRVAAALTAVPADPGFGARLAARLDASARGSWTWTVAAAGAAAIALAMAIVRLDPSVAPIQQARAIGSATPFAEAVAAVAPVPASTSTASTATAAPAMARVRTTVRAASEAPAMSVPAIAALPDVETIGVDVLTLRDLQLAPVDVTQLDIATLEIPQIGVAEDPQE